MDKERRHTHTCSITLLYTPPLEEGIGTPLGGWLRRGDTLKSWMYLTLHLLDHPFKFTPPPLSLSLSLSLSLQPPLPHKLPRPAVPLTMSHRLQDHSLPGLLHTYTLRPAVLSVIERLSSLRRLKCTSIIENEPLLVSLGRFFSIASFTWSGIIRGHTTQMQ